MNTYTFKHKEVHFTDPLSRPFTTEHTDMPLFRYRGEMESLRVHAKLRQDRIAEITGQKVCGNIRTTCFHKLADQLLRETRTLERDNYYLDTRLREPKKKKRKRAGSTSGINWGQASSASFLSGQTGGLLSKAVSASACAPEGVSDTGSYPA